MKIFELFSKRQADIAKAGQADVYQYDDIPANLRVQIMQIAVDAIGPSTAYYGAKINHNPWWDKIEKIFLREKGLTSISKQKYSGSRIKEFMTSCSTADFLDILELIVTAICAIGRKNDQYYRKQWEVDLSTEDATGEINYRIRQAGVGYQIEGAQLIRVDSQYLHAEAVKPALQLLSEAGFDGPQQEFLKAHAHFRAGEHRQAISMAANALESTFKAIFDQKGWQYQRGARISDLLKVGRENGLWPDYLDTSFNQLVATLQNGLPKIRDNDAAHGQGAAPKEVPSYIAAYAIHLAASKILFIVAAAK